MGKGFGDLDKKFENNKNNENSVSVTKRFTLGLHNLECQRTLSMESEVLLCAYIVEGFTH